MSEHLPLPEGELCHSLCHLLTICFELSMNKSIIHRFQFPKSQTYFRHTGISVNKINKTDFWLFPFYLFLSTLAKLRKIWNFFWHFPFYNEDLQNILWRFLNFRVNFHPSELTQRKLKLKMFDMTYFGWTKQTCQIIVCGSVKLWFEVERWEEM